MRRNNLHVGNNAVFDFIAARMEADRIISVGLSGFLVLIAILSLVAGISIWPVVFGLSTIDSSIGSICSAIRTVGWILFVFCMVCSLFLAFFQHDKYNPIRSFLLSFAIYWLIFSIFLILQHGMISDLPISPFMGTLLWLIFSIILGYIFSVLPTVLITVVISLVRKIADVLLPE